MKSLTFAATIVAAFAFTGAAFAQAPTADASGHYEWHTAPQHGPRTVLAAPQRVWVADVTARADCPMMRTNAPECRAMMQDHAG